MKTYTIVIKTPDYIGYESPATDEPLVVLYITDDTPMKAARNAQEAVLRMFTTFEDLDDLDIDDFKVVLLFIGSKEGSIALQIDLED